MPDANIPAAYWCPIICPYATDRSAARNVTTEWLWLKQNLKNCNAFTALRPTLAQLIGRRRRWDLSFLPQREVAHYACHHGGRQHRRFRLRQLRRIVERQ